MTKIFPTVVRRASGPSGPAGFTDEFSLKIGAADINAAPTDDMSIALTFPEDPSPAPTDALSLGFQLDDDTAVPTDDSSFVVALQQDDVAPGQTDADTYAMALTQTDVNADLVETVMLGLPAPDFADVTDVPSEANSFAMRVWLSASAQTAGVVSNPSNANGQNNGTVASMTTAALGTNPVMTSTLGANLPAGVATVSAIYRGWWQAVITIATSHCIITVHSTTAAFADFNMTDITASENHLTGDFTFDLIAAGVNTLAKLQSVQILHKSTDAVAGVTPAVLTVDAGCIELQGAFT